MALDSETDTVPGYDDPRTVLLQYCDIDADTEDAVVMLEGVDDARGKGCFQQLMDAFERTFHQVEVSVYNLNYEWSRISREYLLRPWSPYKWTSDPHASRHSMEWFVLENKRGGVYVISIWNRQGARMRITGDEKRISSRRMKDLAELVHSEHPEWWPEDADMKLDIPQDAYNSGWSIPGGCGPYRDLYLAYSKRDAFSQSRIMKALTLSGRGAFITKASYGMYTALSETYGKRLTTYDFVEQKRVKERFQRRYPPLDADMQDIVEGSLLGGYVWGVPGTHKGTFVHLDFSSSYPKELYNGKSFEGRVRRTSDPKEIERILGTRCRLWAVVSFEFELRKFDSGLDAMPALIGGECVAEPGEQIAGQKRRKMRYGQVYKRLYAWTYLEELRQHYALSEFRIHELWYARPHSGEFAEFIAERYNAKNELKHAGKKLQATMCKDAMNTGPHGKTIQRTRQWTASYETGERVFHEDIQAPAYNAMIGFDDLQNGRERLLRCCRKVLEAGHRVLMCDTDSMVIDCSEAEARRILEGDISETGDIRDLGKLQFETSDDGMVEFEEFRCWGLKRYLEIHNGECRKSAFAGMKEGIQRTLLIDLPTDGQYFQWTQATMINGEWGKRMVSVTKEARAEDPYQNATLYLRGRKEDGLR